MTSPSQGPVREACRASPTAPTPQSPPPIGRSGAAEQAPLLPAASRIGTGTAAAGPGSSPVHGHRQAYLAGPYKRRPAQLRRHHPGGRRPLRPRQRRRQGGAFVDRESAQVTVKTDPIPQILDGIPLRIRSSTSSIDSPDFTLNPTNCAPKSVAATLGRRERRRRHRRPAPSRRACDQLAFSPKLGLGLKGAMKRRPTRAEGHHSRHAWASQPRPRRRSRCRTGAPRQLPHQNDLHPSPVRRRSCPPESIYGIAPATTPLVDSALGPRLPTQLLQQPPRPGRRPAKARSTSPSPGRIDLDQGRRHPPRPSKAIPDTPVSSFVLELQGGSKGLLENSKNLCAKTLQGDGSVQRPERPHLEAETGAHRRTACKHFHGAKKKHRAGKHGRSRRLTRRLTVLAALAAAAPPGRHGRPGRRRAADP